MRVIGIETSCDETGIAIYDDKAGLMSHALYSQVKLHADYGGVVPELASRDHVRKIVPLIRQALAEAGTDISEIDGVAYTKGPGLIGALLVGPVSAVRWLMLGAYLLWGYTIWKGICWRLCWKRMCQNFLLSPC